PRGRRPGGERPRRPVDGLPVPRRGPGVGGHRGDSRMNRQARTGPLLAPPGPAPGEAFGRAFDRLRDELVGTLSSVLRNADDAQDVAQETFLRCWRRRGRLPEVRNLRAWAFRVALNAATDLRRSAWRRKARPLPRDDVLPLEDEAPGPGAALDE